MKKLTFLPFLLAILLASTQQLAAQTDDLPPAIRHFVDSLNTAWKWQTGAVTIGDQLATINVPQGWRYLPADQSKFVLEDMWGNPPGTTLGLLFPANVQPLDSNVVAFDINFEEMGFVKDDDADDIDYNTLLSDMQKEAVEASKQRVEMGYEPIKIVGWAASPYYDKDKKVLHWAKEIQFGAEAEVNTLNYDVRVLGRKGVLSLNAISSMRQLETVKAAIPGIVAGTQFTTGNTYGDFNPDLDQIAVYSLGGLVAGKVLAKAGFFAIILKFIKPILLGLLAFGGAIWRFVTGRRKKEDEEHLSSYDTKAPNVNDGAGNDNNAG